VTVVEMTKNGYVAVAPSVVTIPVWRVCASSGRLKAAAYPPGISIQD